MNSEHVLKERQTTDCPIGQVRASADLEDGVLVCSACGAEVTDAHTPASDATRPPDAAETPDAGVGTSEGRTEPQSDVCGNVCHGIGDGVMFCTRPADHDGGHTDGTAWWTPRDRDARGMDNQGEELDRLRTAAAVVIDAWDNHASSEPCKDCLRSGVDLMTFDDHETIDEAVDALRDLLDGAE